ncbi:MAG: isoprenoid biosynthesis glyoxalase ElbB [Phycisphaeraceae bacterium JB051]
MAKFAIVLAGCGVFDGSEIYEATATMYAIDSRKHEYTCFSIDKPMMHVVNHAVGQPADGESRNVLTESARLARGQISNLTQYNPSDFDALIFPGGFGVAKNLCTYAVDGAGCDIDPVVQKAILDTHAAGKVLGSLCISPALIARAFKDADVTPKLTAGNDGDLEAALPLMGGMHEACDVDKACVDSENRIVSSPAFLSATCISEVFASADAMIDAVLKLI